MLLHTGPAPASGSDHAGLGLLAAILIVGGAVNLLAAFIGLRRKELRSTQGRQLQAALGRRGALAFWLVAGILCIAAGLWLLALAL
jgi:hypothetical protein